MGVYDLLIVFSDGAQKIVEGVSGYGIECEGKIFRFTKKWIQQLCYSTRRNVFWTQIRL